MQNRQNVNTETKFFDTDGFMLTDIDTNESVMLIPCDTAGNFSWTGVTRAPLQRNAMKTSNTSNQYSDLEPPWISIPQENWTGGRGNAIFTKDTTRYLDGKRAQAAFNEVIYNGPLDYYSTGFRKADSNCPGSLKWKKVTGTIVKKITPSVSFNAGEIYIHLRRRGTPVEPLTVKLVSSPNASTALAEHAGLAAERARGEVDAQRPPEAARGDGAEEVAGGRHRARLRRGSPPAGRGGCAARRRPARARRGRAGRN